MSAATFSSDGHSSDLITRGSTISASSVPHDDGNNRNGRRTSLQGPGSFDVLPGEDDQAFEDRVCIAFQNDPQETISIRGIPGSFTRLPNCISESTLITTLYASYISAASFASLPANVNFLTLDTFHFIDTSAASMGFDENGNVDWEEVFTSLSFVESITLSNCSLKGTLTSTIPGSVNYFSVPHNELSGPIPQTLFQGFSSASSLSFGFVAHDNRLDGIIPSSLFPSWAFSSTMMSFKFDLSNNNISGALPPPLLAHVSATHVVFNLAENQISGSIPAGFFPANFFGPAVGSLEVRFNDNLLDGPLPNNLFTFDSTTVVRQIIFDASNNFISHLPPSLVNVRWADNIATNKLSLILSNNALTGDISSTLFIGSYFSANATFSSIQVSLDSNHLTGTIPPNLFYGYVETKKRDDGGDEIWSDEIDSNSKRESMAPTVVGPSPTGQLVSMRVDTGKPFILDLGSNNLADTFPSNLLSYVFLTATGNHLILSIDDNEMDGTLSSSVVFSSLIGKIGRAHV